MRLDDFDFPLPRELIADHPCEPREAARLLHIPAQAGFADRRIADLPALLRPGDLLVLQRHQGDPGAARRAARRGNDRYHPLPGSRRRVVARLCQRRSPAACGRSPRFRRGFRRDRRGEASRRRRDPTVRPRSRGIPRGARPSRRDAAAALHQASAWRRSARPGRLSDDVRPRRRRGRRADGGSAFHPGADRFARQSAASASRL